MTLAESCRETRPPACRRDDRPPGDVEPRGGRHRHGSVIAAGRHRTGREGARLRRRSGWSSGMNMPDTEGTHQHDERGGAVGIRRRVAAGQANERAEADSAMTTAAPAARPRSFRT